MNPASILVIDDEADLRETTALILEQRGYTVACAANGKEGWELCLQMRPHLVLLDIRLPDVDGRTLCRRIKSMPILNKVFVILISGSLFTPKDQIDGFQSGADSYLSRPIESGVLLAHIEALLRIRRREIALEEKDRELDEARQTALRIMRDADTQRRRAKEALSQLEASTQNLLLLSRAIEKSPVSVIITSFKGVIEYVNPQFTETMGYAEPEVIGKPVSMLQSDYHSAEFYQEMRQTLVSGRTWRAEVCDRKKTGESCWCSTAISCVNNAAGEITHFVTIKEDITARKQLEAELRQAKDAADAANRAKSAFLAHMSHEIRTPMNAILGYSQLLQRDPSLPANAAENIRTINRSGEHLLNLINGVLEMSKIEAGCLSLVTATFDLPALLTDLGSMFRLRTEAKGLDFKIVYEGEAPVAVVSDEGKLRQVLVNLLSNAIKFTAEGSVTLRVSTRKESTGALWLIMAVEDTGAGIAEGDFDKLFSLFGQTASGSKLSSGTGLGLAISREYARLMGGDVFVESEWGKGSTFRLEIPIQISSEASRNDSALLRRVIGLRANLQPVRVLIVDGNPANRDWLTKLLASVGFKIREATDGAGALREWEAWQPHLILMGLLIPGMNGCEATRAIRAHPGPHRPYIFAVTASVFDEMRDAALEAGVDAFLPKPLKESDLFEKIHEVLNVEYLYAHQDPGTVAAAAAPESQARPVEKLPTELVEAMRHAIQNGEMEHLRDLIGKVSPYDEDFSKLLHLLADQYEFDALFRLLPRDR